MDMYVDFIYIYMSLYHVKFEYMFHTYVYPLYIQLGGANGKRKLANGGWFDNLKHIRGILRW